MSERIQAMSALGMLIIIHPCFAGPRAGEQWEVVLCNAKGQWQSGSIHDTKAEAMSERASLFTLHRKLKREQDAKAKKRKSSRTASSNRRKGREAWAIIDLRFQFGTTVEFQTCLAAAFFHMTPSLGNSSRQSLPREIR